MAVQTTNNPLRQRITPLPRRGLANFEESSAHPPVIGMFFMFRENDAIVFLRKYCIFAENGISYETNVFGPCGPDCLDFFCIMRNDGGFVSG